MEIAVNKCYGGFDLSDKACERLVELGIPLLKYNKSGNLPKKANDSPYIVKKDFLENLGKYYTSFTEYRWRTHPLLIQVIKELKKEANGRFGNIVIIEIPDNIDWEIDDYDGIETIHEAHQSW